MNKEIIEEWFYRTDFKTMERMFHLHHENFDKAEGYQDFVDECENRWEGLSQTEKESLYYQYA